MNSPSILLCLNAGSSSLRYALFRQEGERIERIRGGIVEEIGDGGKNEFRQAVERMMEDLAPDLGEGLAAVGHRVVHGGSRYAAPVPIDAEVLAFLRETIRLAPEHQPGALAGIEAMQELDPTLPQVACFDTAFHQSLPPRAQWLALPERFWKAGLRRYGFHGLSYEFVRGELGPGIPERTIIAHLGNGSSLAALRKGRPLDTTMGFTPNSGLVMGARCGDLEPGVVLHLLRQEGFTCDTLDSLLNEHSGLRGVSGFSSDMRRLLEAESRHEGARRAIELYCYSARKHIGALAAALEGLDLLVFTGGIGENAEAVRDRITQPLRSYLDFEVRVIPTDEERIVARHTAALSATTGRGLAARNDLRST